MSGEGNRVVARQMLRLKSLGMDWCFRSSPWTTAKSDDPNLLLIFRLFIIAVHYL